MVDDVASVSRVQAGASAQSAMHHSGRASAAANYIQAVTDAIILSARARQVINELSPGQTVAEAWLSHYTRPPDLIHEAVQAASSSAGAHQGDGKAPASMQAAMNRAMGDLSWLFDAMSPPRVDTNVVAQVLAERMAADAVGINPPLPQVVAQAEHTGTVPALYVENLAITAGMGGTTATVDRVMLTTIDPTLAKGAADADRPLVVDVGGEARKVASESLPTLPGEKSAAEQQQARQDERQAADKAETARQRALLIIRQGGEALPEGTLRVKLDVLLPL